VFGQSFIIHTVDGPLSPAPLGQLAGDLSLSTTGYAPKNVPAGGVVAIRHATQPLPGFLNQNVLVLTNGDRIPIDLKGPWKLEQDRLYFRPAAPLRSRDSLHVSVNYASVLCLGDAAAFEDQESLITRLQHETRPRDLLLLMDGDRLEGVLKSLDAAAGATLETSGQETRVPLAKIRAIAMSSEFRSTPRVKGAYAHVVLAGGGRIGLAQPQLEDAPATPKDTMRYLSGKPIFGGPQVQVPLTEIRAIDVRQGPAVYLSDLPGKYESTPFLKLSWPLGKDRSASGRPLQLGPDTFDKGLGMHSQSKVSYQLAGKYRWFEAAMGLDELQGRLGQVRIKVLLDGKEQDLASAGLPGEPAAKINPVRRWQDGGLRLRCNVQGVRELTLAVEYADFGDVQGQVNWGDARLIK